MTLIVRVVAVLNCLLATFAAPAAADTQVGSWVAVNAEKVSPLRCTALTMSLESEGALMATVGELGVIKFMVSSESLSLLKDQQLTAEFSVDGKAVDLKETRVLEKNLVGFIGTAPGRNEGSLLRTIEEGDRAVVQLAGIRVTFDLEGSRPAMQMISDCDMNGGRMATAAGTSTDSYKVAGQQHLTGEDTEAWVVQPATPDFESGCYVSRTANDGTKFFVYQEYINSGVGFGVYFKSKETENGAKTGVELLIDGELIPRSHIRAQNSNTLVSPIVDNSADFIGRLRHGENAEFRFEDIHARFELEGFAEAIPRLAECVAANDRSFASRMSGNTFNRALGITVTPNADGDVSVTAGKSEYTQGTPSEPSANSMNSLLERKEAYAQLRCSIPTLNFVGLYGANSGPVEFDIAINDDATAFVQGSQIVPVANLTEPNSSGPSAAVYRANEVYSASNQSPVAGMFDNPPSGQQDPFIESFLGALRNPGSMVPENRFLSISLLNNDVTVADQLPNGEFGNVTSHRCYRLR